MFEEFCRCGDSEDCRDVVGMNGEEFADSGEDFVVGLILGGWVGVASRPRDSKTADIPSPNSRLGELGDAGS